jgi:hypothetical protein
MPRARGADGSGTTTTVRAFRTRAAVTFARPRFRPLEVFISLLTIMPRREGACRS